MTTNKDQQRGPGESAEKPSQSNTHTSFLEEPHGRHGGSEESEGRPQKDAGTLEKDDRAQVDESNNLPE